ncbi:unnamed protein product, partial [Owenia fusiformis]
DENEAGKPPPPELQYAPYHKLQKLSKSEFEDLYIEVLYTIKHKVGTTIGGHSPFMQDLYLYAREAFGVTPEDHAHLLAKASKEMPPTLILIVTVIEARNLEAKDADGFSDPYCMLGIMPYRDRSQSITSASSEDELENRESPNTPKNPLKKFSNLSFKKRSKDKGSVAVRDELPAKYIKSTSYKPDTLNPVWNEKFRFDLDCRETDCLHIDIWDHDDEFSVLDAAKTLNEVSGFKGLNRFFKQVAQSARTNNDDHVDDFLGCVNIKVSEIPSTGIEDWFSLEGRSDRSNIQGEIKLNIKLATREYKNDYIEGDNWDDLAQHEDLLCMFIKYEITKFRYETFRWTGDLPQAARTILHQHAIQGDVTDAQQSACRWMAYSKMHIQNPFDYMFLLRLLKELDEIWQPPDFSREEEEKLSQSFSRFIEFCMNLLRRVRDAFPGANKAAFHRLQGMLKCLSQIYDMEVFRYCSPFRKELRAEIKTALKSGTEEWYMKTFENTRPNGDMSAKDEESTVQRLIQLCALVNMDLHKAEKYYNKLFVDLVNVNFLSSVYRQFEKLISNDVVRIVGDELGPDAMKNLEHLKELHVDEKDLGNPATQQSGITLFELYMSLQEFTKFRKELPSDDRKQLAITKYYEWFQVPVEKWLVVAKLKCMHRIQKAVELDKEVDTGEGSKTDDKAKHSTSAVDICACFQQIVDFWRQLDWQDHSTGLVFVTSITQDICNGAMYYADLIHDKLKAAGYYDEIGQFDVTQQLCITINDIEQVRRSLKPLPEQLRYEQIAAALDKKGGSTESGKQARQNLYMLIHKADENMGNKIKLVTDRVADKMRPALKKDVFHLCWSPEKVPAAEAISALMEYLDSNLLTLNNNLLRTNFDRILDSIWVEVLEEIRDVVESEDQKTTLFHKRLYESLNILVDFFHANDKGLPLQRMHTKQYQELNSILKLSCEHTDRVIEAYYIDKINKQNTTERVDFGTLSVRVYYNTDAEILFVEVLNAKNILPLDANGLSDPFVLIELCPAHLHTGQHQQQTKIIKKTLNPTFDESFEFNISRAHCKQPGSCVLFTVMDHDLMFRNDFAGEVYLSLNHIPGISGEDVSGFTALTPLTLPLIQPPKNVTADSPALAVLERRLQDPKAMEFVKRRKQVQDQSA